MFRSKERLGKFGALCHDVPHTPSCYIHNTAINGASLHTEHHAGLSSVREVRSLLHSYPQTVASLRNVEFWLYGLATHYATKSRKTKFGIWKEFNKIGYRLQEATQNQIQFSTQVFAYILQTTLTKIKPANLHALLLAFWPTTCVNKHENITQQ